MNLKPGEIQKGSFPETYKLLDAQIKKYNNDPVKKKFYENIKSRVKDAEKSCNSLIEKSKQIMLKDPADPTKTKSFFDLYVSGKEQFVSLLWFSDKIGSEERLGNIDHTASTVNIASLSYDNGSVNTKPDFIDKTKSVWHQFTHQKGIAKFLANGCLAVGLGEVISKGVTSYLVKEEIVKSSMGLFGLVEMGIDKLPLLSEALSFGMNTIWNFSPLAVGLAGGFIALKAIPLARGLVDKLKAKHKDANALETGIKKVLNDQPDQSSVLS